MKTVTILLSLFVLLLIAVPVSADQPVITSISPNVGYQSSTPVTIMGSNFNTSSVDVKLTMNGKGNITVSSVTPVNSTAIVCTLPLTTDHAVGTWNVVVVNKDNTEGQKIDAFHIREPITLSSISPVSGRTNNVSTKVSVVGTGLSYISGIYLYNEDYNTNTSASGIVPISSLRVNGTFDLTGKTIDTYQICIVDSYGTQKCGLSFKVTSDAVGSIEVSSSPSSADLYIDGTKKGTTPITVDDLDAGYYKLIVKKDGYTDWTRTAKVTDGSTASFTANLEVKTAAPTATASTVATTVPTTAVLTRKVTATAPTPWPSSTPAQESPVSMLAIIGGIGLALIAVRKY